MDLKSSIREVQDFPKKGILFYDITTLLKDPVLFQEVIYQMTFPFLDKGIQKVVAIESRGFILGGPIARRLNAGFVPARKPGKLPAEQVVEKYSLEYGFDSLAIHRDAISPGESILVVDDLLATGGTMSAAVNLVKRLGGKIAGIAFLIELKGLKGRERLHGLPLISLLTYD